MSTQEISPNERVLINRFEKEREIYYNKILNDINEILLLPDEVEKRKRLTVIKQKYIYLKKIRFTIRSNKKLINRACIYEILNDDDIIEKFTTQEKKIILEHYIKKSRGIYKHSQTEKTFLCNLKIIEGYQTPNTISVCITKNTITANLQWLERLCKDLKINYPNSSLEEQILIISSKKNKDLKGKATHCKTIDNAWSYLKKKNTFRVIFVCSNKTRLNDILEICESFHGLIEQLKKNLIVIHDEAHNTKEGIPAYRRIIENIICQPNIIQFIPCTASNETLEDKTNPLWKKENLEKYAINYSGFRDTTSNSPEYSSCKDATPIIFEDLREKSGWSEYGIREIPTETFKHAYPNEKDIERKRKLDYDSNELFTGFIGQTKEVQAVNNGLNVLNLNNILEYNLFIPNELNIHIISTPLRNCLTRYLAEEALKMNYNPIVLAIYGEQNNKYHLFVDNIEKEVSFIMGSGEFNNMLDTLLQHLDKKGTNIKRPFIILGNYNPTGESITYVNFKYGTIRSNTRLISTIPVEDYQEACRLNYMLTKFREQDSEFIPPEKFLIGEEKFINNAIRVEEENDIRVNDMLENRLNLNSQPMIEESFIANQTVSEDTGTIAVPAKISVDRSDPEIIKLIQIAKKSRRVTEDKTEFLKQLYKCINDDEIDCELYDPTGKLLIDSKKKNYCYEIQDFRTYRKADSDEGPKEGQWKFTSYQRHHQLESPFINNRTNIYKNQIDILIPIDKYIIKGTDGIIKEQNSKNVWWLGYKY